MGNMAKLGIWSNWEYGQMGNIVKWEIWSSGNTVQYGPFGEYSIMKNIVSWGI